MAKPKGQVIQINEAPFDIEKRWGRTAIVQDLLNVQFTAIVQDGTETLFYRFYNDEGDTWRNAT